MTKRDKLHEWLMLMGDWLYLSEVPHDRFDMSYESCSGALRDLCAQGRADYRIVGLKQYRGVPADAVKRGPKPPRGRL